MANMPIDVTTLLFARAYDELCNFVQIVCCMNERTFPVYAGLSRFSMSKSRVCAISSAKTFLLVANIQLAQTLATGNTARDASDTAFATRDDSGIRRQL